MALRIAFAPQDLPEDLLEEGQINDLQNQVLEIAKAKRSVEEKNNCLPSENGRLQDRVTELGTAVRCLDEDLQSKDVLLRELTQPFREVTERQHQLLQVLQNGKALFVHQSENGKPANGVHEKVLQPNAVAELNTSRISIAQNGTLNHVPEKPGL